MEEGNVTVLVDAKEEYTKQLISILKACIYQGIKSIYMDAKDICNQENTPDNVLMVFQDLLSRIPKWSQDIINKEYERITSVSKCDYIDDLLKVVYVSHIKILTIVHSAQRNKKISIKVPSGSHFIHLCYIECAREFWKDPYYFSDRVSKYELQKNMRDSENMISDCIMETIRKQLPVRHILKEFLNEPDEDIEEEEDIKEPSKKKYLKKLETVVKKELKSTTNNSLGNIDIEIIRKVIREEMESKSISSSTPIKKELVDTVVEKIVEKAQDGGSLEDKVDSVKTNVIDSSVKTTTLDKDVEKNIETNLETNIDNTVLTKSVLESDVLPSIEETKGTTKETSLGTSSVSNVSNVSSVSNEEEAQKVILKETNQKKKETSGGNRLEKLLDANASDDDEDNIEVDSIITNTIKDEEVSKEVRKEGSKEGSKKNELVINNIDEINLNLDEIDDELDVDLDEEVDLDSIKVPELKSSVENTKDANTKYIFFDDA